MKIQNALEIADDCGLETVGEAIFNIQLHAGNLFSYSDVHKELEELTDTWKWIKEHRKTPDGKSNIDGQTKVPLMLQYHIAEDLADYEIHKLALKDDSLKKRLME